ncbi:hypothetical protein N2W54_002063 [Lotmaria passim]
MAFVSSLPLPTRGANTSKLPALSARSASRVTATASATRDAGSSPHSRLPVITTAASSSSSCSSSSSSFVVFPEIADQLPCSPDNALWVYGRYELSYFATEATAQGRIAKLLRAMLREARRHYELSRAFFCALRPEEQRAEVLRCAETGVRVGSVSSSSSNNNNSIINNNGSSVMYSVRPNANAVVPATTTPAAGVGGDFANVNAACSTTGAVAVQESVYRALREAWPVWESSRSHHRSDDSDDDDVSSGNDSIIRTKKNKKRSGSGGGRDGSKASGVGGAEMRLNGARGGNHNNNSNSRSAGWSAENTGAAATVEKEGSLESYPPGLRVNLVLDIVASRKTLGATPLQSRAYRIAENVYRLVMQPTTTQTVGTTAATGTAEERVGDNLHDLSPYVRTLVIGISDTDITLVGRDVVCPYRHLLTPPPLQMRFRCALEAMADAPLQPPQPQRPPSPSASISPTDRGGVDDAGSSTSLVEASLALQTVVAKHLQGQRSLEALLPAPYMRVPPTLLSQLDQTRLILCVPPIECSAAEKE